MELLTCITILGLISIVLAQAMIVGFKTLDDAAARTQAATDAALLSAYFPPDVHSADAVNFDPTACADNVTAKVSFVYTAGSRVTYGIRESNGEEHLVRVACEGSTVLALQTIAWALDPVDASDVAVQVRCLPLLASCPENQQPEMVTMTVRQEGGYHYDVTGTRRVRP